METFDEIYILDLHGSAKKKETTPEGGKDENVFDIQQGVCIGIFVKQPGKSVPSTIYHSDMFGSRADKYKRLLEYSLDTTPWQHLDPQRPYYFLLPFVNDLLAEYEAGWKVPDIFPVNSVGLVTARDQFTIHWSKDDVWNIVKEFSQLKPESAREKYNLGRDSQDWKVHLAQADLLESGPVPEKIVSVLYRPFDIRHTYYTGKAGGFLCRPRPEVMRNMLVDDNLALITSRLTKGETYQHTQVTRNIVEVICMSPKTSNNGFVFPLYIEPGSKREKQKKLFDSAPWETEDGQTRTPNFSPTFIAELEAKLNLRFQPIQRAVTDGEFGPEDVFHYIYAVLHSPTYRARYAEFLKIDFPRVPLTGDPALFAALTALGRQLVALHLLEAPEVNQPITRYPVRDSDRVEKGYPKYTRATDEPAGRVHINQTQYFDGVPEEVWGFHVGGYQVLEKWLKDRRGRQLSYDDLTHYRRVVVALQRTMALMAEIDATIPAWPIE